MFSLKRFSLYFSLLTGAILFSLTMEARDYSNWMAELPDEAFVCTLSIPGSHDSATGHGFTGVFSSIAANSGQTQDLSISQQIEMGVRAFDFRPGNKSNRLKCYHGTGEIDLYFDDAIKEICSWLNSHPTEFFFIHLYPGNNDDSKTNSLYNALMQDASVKDHIANFDPSLKVKDMRGKILFFRRYQVNWDNSDIPAQLYDWDETEWKTNEYHVKKGGWEEKGCRIIMQDKANTSPEDKIARVTELYEYSSSYSPASEQDMVWFFNFASSYNGITSSRDTYLSNAAAVHPAFLRMLETTVGPTGIVLMDWIGDDNHLNKSNNAGMTQGETLVHAIADNNFRYLPSMVTPNFKSPEFTDLNLKDILPFEGSFRGNMEWVDVNSDGKLDLVFKGRDTQDGWWPKYMVAINDGNGLSSSSYLPRPGANEYNDNNSRIIVPIDYNADGHVDLIYGCANGSVLLANDGNGNYSEVTAFTLNDSDINLDQINDGTMETRGCAGLMHVADFNLDGYPDILTYSRGANPSEGTPILFLNNSGNGTFTQCNHTLPALKNGTMAIGDYDCDGDIDVLISGINASGKRQISICLNQASTGNLVIFEIDNPAELQPYATDLGMVGLIDLNNDGLLDVFISGRRYESDHNQRMALSSNIFLRQDDGTFLKTYSCSLPMSGNGMDWCDVNGDGYIDIIYSGNTNIITGWNTSDPKHSNTDSAVTSILINQGDGTFHGDHSSLAPLRSGSYVSAGDMNGDGQAEIALIGYGSPCVHIYSPKTVGSSQVVHRAAEVISTGAKMEATSDGKTVISWNTTGESNRYNYVVKTKDGKVFSAVPVDPETGTLRVANLNAAPTGHKVTLNINPEDVDKFAVQSINPDKSASGFELIDNPGSTVGIKSINNEDNSTIEFFNLQGQRVTDPHGGYFIERHGSKNR